MGIQFKNRLLSGQWKGRKAPLFAESERKMWKKASIQLHLIDLIDIIVVIRRKYSINRRGNIPYTATFISTLAGVFSISWYLSLNKGLYVWHPLATSVVIKPKTMCTQDVCVRRHMQPLGFVIVAYIQVYTITIYLQQIVELITFSSWKDYRKLGITWLDGG